MSQFRSVHHASFFPIIQLSKVGRNIYWLHIFKSGTHCPWNVRTKMVLLKSKKHIQRPNWGNLWQPLTDGNCCACVLRLQTARLNTLPTTATKSLATTSTTTTSIIHLLLLLPLFLRLLALLQTWNSTFSFSFHCTALNCVSLCTTLLHWIFSVFGLSSLTYTLDYVL